jgi:superfamily II DNA or RNA helicase/HKD family nuclease
MKLAQGVYEHLITSQLQSDIHEMEQEGMRCLTKELDSAEAPQMLVKHLETIIHRKLSEMEEDEQIDFANRLVQQLDEWTEERVMNKDEILTEVVTQNEVAQLEAIGKAGSFDRKKAGENRIRPLSGFRVSNLFTGGQSALSLSSEIERDIVSADRINLIVSFLKLSGVNLIYDALEHFCSQPGHQLRLITTTYCGVTDGKAVQRLSELPNTEIRISYQTQIERLHAKSYIFERNSGMSTAYIGSSNLSKSAQTDGLEWNIRVTNVENPHIIKTALATFEQYWNSPNFEDFRLGGIEKFNREMDIQTNPSSHPEAMNVYALLPHQKQILDKLQVERDHGLNRNLIVAATGTGKTVISAFDYQALSLCEKRHLKVLFVAHREEILKQTLHTYRSVLNDANFGELWTGQYRPQHDIDHLFVSVQTFNSRYEDVFAQLSPTYYEYIVIDEAHHAKAESYIKIFRHFTPRWLVGLTATPERMDGQSLLPDFGNKISAEIRLPKALDAGLLTPFQYYCISDSLTDLSDDELMSGHKYIVSKMSERLQTTQRVALIVDRLRHYLADESKCKALCFCADKAHAVYMATEFKKWGYEADYLTSDSSHEDRKRLNTALKEGRINYLFVVDIYNEGVDIPQVDTVLFLRPTESLTIFLQQLGRGLRLSAGKTVLTVLDFVSQLHKKYDYAKRFRSLMTRTDRSVKDQIQNGFTLLPHGCHIHMEEKAQQYVLQNIQAAIYNKRRLVEELQSFASVPTLQQFVMHLEQDIRLIYKGDGCWTSLKREAGFCTYADDENTRRFQKGMGQLVHINTPGYLHFVKRVLAAKGDVSTVSEEEKTYSLMLYYMLFQEPTQKVGVASAAQALSRLKQYPLFIKEMEELTDYLLDNLEVNTFSIGQQLPGLLEQYGCYTREEVFMLFGRQTETKKMQGSVSGAFKFPDYNVEALFVTLNKSDKDFSPSTQYEDYVMGERSFHWQSQNTDTHEGSGRRFVEQRRNGKRFLLFVREDKRDGFGNTCPFYCFGLVNYVRSTGNRPMSIEWELEQPILPQFIKTV